jgi:hypothetical protein
MNEKKFQHWQVLLVTGGGGASNAAIVNILNKKKCVKIIM